MSQVLGTQLLQSSVVATWTAQTTVAGDPDEVLAALTEPDVIARWAPIEFELVDRRYQPLRAGDSVRVRGYLAGRRLEFRVEVAVAGNGRLLLSASGPIDLEVEYLARPLQCGSAVRASVGVSGRGLIGRMLAQATDTVLAAGALNAAVARIARELEDRPVIRHRGRSRELEPALAA
jgi:hypothetical protein